MSYKKKFHDNRISQKRRPVKRDRKLKTDIFNTGPTTVVTCLQQAAVGLAITIGLYYLPGSFPDSVLLPAKRRRQKL